MRVATSLLSSNFLSQINTLQQQQLSLQSQSTTGLKFTLPDQDPSGMGTALDLQTASSANDQYQSNITTLQAQANTSYAAMNSLKTISDRVSEITTLASSSTTSTTQMASYATEVDSLLQQAVQIANTKDSDGNYIFAGTDSSTQPFTAATDANGSVTGVSYSGNSSVASTEIAQGVTVSAQTVGVNTGSTGATGLFVDSRSGADFFNHLISLRNDLQSGDTAAIGTTDQPNIAKDEANIINQISTNSVTQSTLTHAATIATNTGTNIATQLSNTTSADLATTLTQLTQTQTAYQAALESGTKIFSLSILDYLQ